MKTKLVAIFLLAIGGGVEAQRRVPGPPAEKTVLAMALKAGNKVYNFNGEGKCTYAPVASVYAMRAEKWSAERTGEAPSATMTVWRPAVGQDMVTLSFTIGETRYSLNTVKVGAKGTPEGSGTVTIARQGPGASFTISGATADGTRISGTIMCGAFSRPTEEGGD